MTCAAVMESRPWFVAGWTMLQFLWVGGALGLAEAVGRRVLRGALPEVRYGFALLCLGALAVAPVVIALVLLTADWPATPPAHRSGQVELSRDKSPELRPVFPVPTVTREAGTEAVGSAPALTSRGAAFVVMLDTVATGLPWLWVFGSPLTFALLVTGLVGAERLCRQARPLGDGKLPDIARRLSTALGIVRPVALAVCDRVAGPVLVGVVHPLILLPPAMLTGWCPEQIEMALLHELAHVRRHDNLVNLVQRVVEALLFFHPAVWWVSGWVRLEREHCCDRLVVAQTGRARPYAELLAALAAPGLCANVTAMAERPVVGRIRRILNQEDRPMRLSRPALALVAALLATPAALVMTRAGVNGSDNLPQNGRAQEAGKKTGPKSPNGPWRAFGRVTDQDGKPLAGVKVSAFCGMGTLRLTGIVTSGEDGHYELNFGPGILIASRNGPTPQAATISATKPGCFEENLNRQGGCLAAEATPDDEMMKRWGGSKDRLFLPGHPLEISFKMRLTGRVSGKLVNEQGQALAGYSVGLGGLDNPPSMGAVRPAEADAQGRFSLEDIPTTFRYQFGVRKSDPKPPWDDSWNSAALRFERPEKGDMRAWFGDREIRLKELVIRVAGPGVHGRTAMPVAGNAGTLDLTVADPSDVLQKTKVLLAAKTAVLTLCNSPRPDPSRSLITESVPVAPEQTPTRLARTRPNEAGEFTITFENPSGVDLVPGKHQVVFQVFVGVSQNPIRQKIFRQLNIRDGRYEVPVKISPEWIDDSRVSLTFLTIQPAHDAWVKSFFHDGKGTSYKGLWTGDGAILSAIPFEVRDGKKARGAAGDTTNATRPRN